MIADALVGMVTTVGRVLNATLENPAMSLKDPRTWDEVLGGARADSGEHVNHRTSLSIPAVWQAISIISGDVACADLDVYKTDGENVEVDLEHPAEFLISQQANEDTTAYEFWRRIVLHALLWGNGYGYIDRSGRVGDPDGLYNLLPDRTAPKRDKNGDLFYVTEVNGELVPLLPSEVLHVKGLSVEPSLGYDLMVAARNCFGLALAAKGFASKFFAHGAQTGGWLEIPTSFTEQAKRNLEEKFEQKYAGKHNWFKVAVLRDGAKFHSTTINPQQSQMVEMSEEEVREVARFFNLPPFKLGLTDSQSYNSCEQSQQVYLTGCLRHWLKAISTEAESKLLDEDQRRERTHSMEHDTSGLLEVDTQTMATVLSTLRASEFINANEGRRRLKMNPRTDPGGTDYRNPNTKSGAPGAEQAPPEKGGKTPPPQKPDEGLEDSARKVLIRDLERMARRVKSHAEGMNSMRFQQWLETHAHDQRQAFDQIAGDSLEMWARVRNLDPQAFRSLAHGKFFAVLIDELSPLIDGPANELPDRLTEKCGKFEAEISQTILSLAC